MCSLVCMGDAVLLQALMPRQSECVRVQAVAARAHRLATLCGPAGGTPDNLLDLAALRPKRAHSQI